MTSLNFASADSAPKHDHQMSPKHVPMAGKKNEIRTLGNVPAHLCNPDSDLGGTPLPLP